MSKKSIKDEYKKKIKLINTYDKNYYNQDNSLISDASEINELS